MSAGQAEKLTEPFHRLDRRLQQKKLRIPVGQRFGFLRPLTPDAENNKVRFVFAYDHRFMDAAAAITPRKRRPSCRRRAAISFDCRRGAQIGNNAVGAEFNRQRGGVFAFKQRNFSAASILPDYPAEAVLRQGSRQNETFDVLSSMQFSALSAVILRINLGISVFAA